MTYVRGVSRDVSKSARGSDGDKSVLELLRGDLLNSEGRVGRRLERDVVGQQTGNVGRGHGSSGDGVDGILAANPGGQNVQARGEDVSALAEVGEVGTLISQSGGTDGDGLLSGSGGVVASISVVVTSSDGEMHASVNSGIHSEVESARATTAQRHVGNATLETLDLTGLGILGLLDVSLGGPLNTLDDIGHGARAVGAENLDGVDIGLLGHTVLLTGNSSRAVSTVTVAVLILVTLGDGLAPVGTALKVDVVNVGASVNHVGINTLTAILSIQILVKATEGEAVTVRDTCQTPRSVLLDGRVLEVVDLRVLLDILDLRGENGTQSAGEALIGGRWADRGRSYLHPDAGGPAQ